MYQINKRQHLCVLVTSTTRERLVFRLLERRGGTVKEYEVTDDVIYSTFTYSAPLHSAMSSIANVLRAKDRVPHSVIRVLSEVRV